jgi:hypothetical protein
MAVRVWLEPVNRKLQWFCKERYVVPARKQLRDQVSIAIQRLLAKAMSVLARDITVGVLLTAFPAWIWTK